MSKKTRFVSAALDSAQKSSLNNTKIKNRDHNVSMINMKQRFYEQPKDIENSKINFKNNK